MSAAAITSSPSTPPQSSKPLFGVRTVDALSCLELMSWKNKAAAPWLPVRADAIYAWAQAPGLSKRRNTVPRTLKELDTLRRLFERALAVAEIAVKLTDRSLVNIVHHRRQMGLVR